MSALLYRVGTTAVERAKSVLLAWIALLLLTAFGAYSLGGVLTNDFTIPGTEGQRGLDVMNERFPELSGTSGQIVFGVDEGEDIHDHRAAIENIVEEASTLPSAETVSNPFDDSMMDPLISDNNRYALAQVQFGFHLDSIDQDQVDQLVEIAQQGEADGMSVHVGGQIMSLTEIPLSPLEAAGVVLALIVLAVAFRSIISATVPIMSALLGVGIAMATVLMLAAFMPISTTTPTLAIMLGLAVGIDYALFIVSRHRDQLAQGLTVGESIPRAIATSGGAVLFAGSTVVIALAALVVAKIPFLSVMGLCAAFAVAVAALFAVTGLPAILSLFGDRLRPKKRRQQEATEEEAEVEVAPRGPSRWWVGVVTSHPWLTIVSVTAIVAVMTIPASGLRIALPDNGVEPESSMPRQTYDLVAQEFGPGSNGPLVVIGDIITSHDPLQLMENLKNDIAEMPNVESVQLATPNRTGDLGVVIIIPREGPEAVSTENLVHDLRSAADTWEDRYDIANVLVTGNTAVGIDVSERLFDALLPFGTVVVGLSLILLLIVFRSVWVSIKATLGYLFSVGAAFGVTSLVFLDGWANDLLFIGQVGPVISFMPIILMGVLFGLAMDYEVFLVSRMREDYVHTGNARESITTGFVASAPVVVAAALIMISVFSGFIPGGSFYVQPIAFGLAIGVAVDAFLVRMTLVPAVLQILGDRAWHIPTWLDRMLPTFDVEGAGMTSRFKHLEWQRQYGKVVARADNVTISDSHGEVVSQACLNIHEGETIRLTGSPIATEAFLATFGARMRPTEGTVFVFDTSTIDEAGRVISRAPYLSHRDIPLRAVSRPRLILINRTLRPFERQIVLDNLDKGGATVLGPMAHDSFDNMTDYDVPTPLREDVLV
ncbi:MAG: MMPL family transporter [Actinomycetaceae bacterium]|nr:MMPL family transporter [Actinomycetaceae bacterium]